MRLMIFRRILWLYRDASWETTYTLFSAKERIIKGQSHEINDVSRDSMAGEGVAEPGRELGDASHSFLHQKDNYKGTISRD
jgi:hypothetical protein